MDGPHSKGSGKPRRLPLVETDRPGSRAPQCQSIELSRVEARTAAGKLAGKLLLTAVQGHHEKPAVLLRLLDDGDLGVPKGQSGSSSLGVHGRRHDRRPAGNCGRVQRIEFRQVDERPGVENQLHKCIPLAAYRHTLPMRRGSVNRPTPGRVLSQRGTDESPATSVQSPVRADDGGQLCTLALEPFLAFDLFAFGYLFEVGVDLWPFGLG